MSTEKTCRDCKLPYPLDKEHFAHRVSKTGSIWWDAYCRPCKAKRSKVWYAATGEATRKKRRDYSREYKRKYGGKAKEKK